MKITFICGVFPPEREPSGLNADQLAARLAGDGHDVTVIAPFPNRPGGEVYPGYRRRWRSAPAQISGYRLVRCANWLVGKRRRSIDRILENITFGFTSAWAAARAGRPDVLLVETWPLFAVQFVALVAAWWRAPFVYYIKDVYPEAAEKAGVIAEDGWLARLCRAWDTRLCRTAARVVVISDGMRELMASTRSVPAEELALIRDWKDAEEFPLHSTDNAWRREQEIPASAFVAMFGGTLGHVSGAGILVDTAALLAERKDVLMLAIGEGVRKHGMIHEARERRLDNLRFLPFQSVERVPEVQAAANVTLLTVQAGSTDSSFPSKLISYLAAGRPVICSAPESSAACRIVREADAGIIVPPGDAAALAAAILRLAGHPDACARLGANARRYFEAHFTLDRAHRQFRELLADVTSSPKAQQSTSPQPAF